MHEYNIRALLIPVVLLFFIFLSCAGANTQARISRLNDLGITCLRNKMFQDAIFWFNKIIELDDQNEAALNNIAIGYEGLGQFETALNYYQMAYEISNNPRILENMNSLKEITGDEEDE